MPEAWSATCLCVRRQGDRDAAAGMRQRSTLPAVRAINPKCEIVSHLARHVCMERGSSAWVDRHFPDGPRSMESRNPPIKFCDPAYPNPWPRSLTDSGACVLTSPKTLFEPADLSLRRLSTSASFYCLTLESEAWICIRPCRAWVCVRTGWELAFRCWEALQCYPFSGRYLFSSKSVDTRWCASTSVLRLHSLCCRRSDFFLRAGARETSVNMVETFDLAAKDGLTGLVA